MSEPVHILSLGAGVQSSTLALMAAAGEVTPMPVVAIFADTQAEPANVITWLDWLEKHLPYSVKRVTAGSLSEDCLELRRSKKSGKIYTNNTIPAFAVHPDGSKGLFGRRCTYNHKIAPIVRELREMIGKVEMREWRKKHAAALKGIEAARKDKNKSFPVAAWEECQVDALVIQWIGISIDEAHRIKPNRQPWIRNRYPLVEKMVSRRLCLQWMKSRGHPEPPRSACTFCPFHSDEEWKALSPQEFEAAAVFEEKLQAAVAKSEVTNCVPYLHASLVPLRKAKFKARNPYEQVSLFGNECEGMCGV